MKIDMRIILRKTCIVLPALLLLYISSFLAEVENATAQESEFYNQTIFERNLLQNDTSIEHNESVKNLAPTPPMGWNSWNWFGKKQINEKVVRGVIDAIVSSGLKDAGYKYVVVDGGWRDTVLGPDGELRPNPKTFPNGIKPLADYAHSKGLKFGLHTVPGTADCGGDQIGGYGQEKVQIQQFVNWGIDFIKLDKCRMKGGWNEALLKNTYYTWNNLLKKCGRQIVLSISAYEFRDWNPAVAQMSRTTGDIGARTNGGARLDTFEIKKPLSVMGISEINSRSAAYAGSGYWNDPDILVVGSQGLTSMEQKLHFSLWCMMSAPLFLGNDPRHMSTCEKEIILNKDCIRIDQDTTEQGTRIIKNGDTEIWRKKLEGGEVAILLVNRNPTGESSISFNFNDIGLKEKVTIKDIWAERKLGTFTESFSRKIEPQSGLFLLIK